MTPLPARKARGVWQKPLDNADDLIHGLDFREQKLRLTERSHGVEYVNNPTAFFECDLLKWRYPDVLLTY